MGAIMRSLLLCLVFFAVPSFGRKCCCTDGGCSPLFSALDSLDCLSSKGADVIEALTQDCSALNPERLPSHDCCCMKGSDQEEPYCIYVDPLEPGKKECETVWHGAIQKSTQLCTNTAVMAAAGPANEHDCCCDEKKCITMDGSPLSQVMCREGREGDIITTKTPCLSLKPTALPPHDCCCSPSFGDVNCKPIVGSKDTESCTRIKGRVEQSTQVCSLFIEKDKEIAKRAEKAEAVKGGKPAAPESKCCCSDKTCTQITKPVDQIECIRTKDGDVIETTQPCTSLKVEELPQHDCCCAPRFGGVSRCVFSASEKNARDCVEKYSGQVTKSTKVCKAYSETYQPPKDTAPKECCCVDSSCTELKSPEDHMECARGKEGDIVTSKTPCEKLVMTDLPQHDCCCSMMFDELICLQITPREADPCTRAMGGEVIHTRQLCRTSMPERKDSAGDTEDGKEEEEQEPPHEVDNGHSQGGSIDRTRDTDIRDTRDTRDLRDTRDTSDLRDTRDTSDLRDTRDTSDLRDTRDTSDLRDTRGGDVRFGQHSHGHQQHHLHHNHHQQLRKPSQHHEQGHLRL